MIQITEIQENDVVNGNNICVSVWFQGCPFRCKGCQNPQTWDFNGGTEYLDFELKDKILSLLNKNGIKRNLSLLGGEPIQEQNISFIKELANAARVLNPNIEIFCWTGYDWNEDLFKDWGLTEYIDYFITGRFILEERDVSLKWRGSRNQQIWHKENNEWKNITESE